MLPKDRVRCAFEKKPSDKIPIYQAGFSSRAASAILGRDACVGGGMQQYREVLALMQGPDAHAEFLDQSLADAIDVCLALDLDYVRPTYWRMNRKPDKQVDEHTFLFGDADGDYEVYRFHPETELFSVTDRRPPAPATVDDLEAGVEAAERGLAHYTPQPDPTLLEALQRVGATHAVQGHGTGCGIPYRPAIWLEAIVLRPDLVARHLDTCVERARLTVPVMAEMGIPYLHGGGDFASNKGPFYSPKVFHDMVLPRLVAISDICNEHGCYHMFASDGDLWSLADDLFAASGIHAFYEMDVKAGMDPARLRVAYPHLTLLGGVNSHTLHRGPAEAIRDEVRHAMQVAHEHGGMIVGASNQIVAGTPMAHIDAMMEEMHRLR